MNKNNLKLKLNKLRLSLVGWRRNLMLILFMIVIFGGLITLSNDYASYKVLGITSPTPTSTPLITPTPKSQQYILEVVSGIDQNQLLNSIDGLLGKLEDLFYFALIGNGSFWYFSTNKERNLELMGVKIPRKNIFLAIVFFEMMINLGLAVQFARLGDLLTLVDQPNLSRGLTTVATHPWIFNPLGYFYARTAYGVGLLMTMGMVPFFIYLLYSFFSVLMVGEFLPFRKDNKDIIPILVLNFIFSFMILVMIDRLYSIFKEIAEQVTPTQMEFISSIEEMRKFYFGPIAILMIVVLIFFTIYRYRIKTIIDNTNNETND